MQIEYRVKAYESFIEADRHRPVSGSRLLSIGAMAEHLSTDGEIQAFEDQFAALLKKSNLPALHSQLVSDFNLLRLHGSTKVGAICDDTLRAWRMRDDEIRWSDCSARTRASHARWKIAQSDGSSYGWRESLC